jgi:hypothetical protein
MRLSDILIKSSHATRLTEILQAIRASKPIEPEDRRWLGHLIGPIAIPLVPLDSRYPITTAAAMRFLTDEFFYRAVNPEWPGNRLTELPSKLVSNDPLTATEVETLERVARVLRTYFLRSLQDDRG